VPVAAVAIFDYLRHTYLAGILHIWPGTIGLMAMVLIGSFLLTQLVSNLFERRKRDLLQAAAELFRLSAVPTIWQPGLDFSAVTNTVLARVLALLQADAGAIYLLDEEGQQLVLSGHRGFQEKIPMMPTLKVEEVASQDGLLLGDQPYVEASAGQESPVSAMLEEHGLLTYFGIPLRSRGKVLGLLIVARRHPDRVADQEKDLLGIVGYHLGGLIDNIHLYEQVQTLAILRERDRIAREMHDSLAQVLGFLSLKAKLASEHLALRRWPEARSEVGEIAEAADSAYHDVREAILGLKESISPELGLVGTLKEYLEKFSRQSGIAARLVVQDEASLSFQPAVELQLIRAIQEALTNVRKHARASHAVITMERDDGWAKITIEDNGQGFEPAKVLGSRGQRFGLQTMVERVSSIGGTLGVISSPGQGTKVIVKLPQRG